MNTWVKNQLRDAWVDSGVHDGRIECSRSPEYALVESAKANEVEPDVYLLHVINNIATADTVEKLEALLPWNVKATSYCQKWCFRT